MSPQTSFLKDIPKDWRSDRMGNVTEILFSNVDKHTFDSEIPVRLCNYVDVYKNDRITSEIEFMEASAEPREIARFQIQIGDVLATKDSETPDDIAIPALVAETLPGVLCGYHLALIRPRAHHVYGPYLAWLHCSKAFRSHYEAQAVGVTRFGLSQAVFKDARVPLPPLPEQQRITDYLDASCAAIDAAVAAKRGQLGTLGCLRETVIQTAVCNGLNPKVRMAGSDIAWMPSIPEHWKRVKLKRHVEMLRGQFTHRPRNDPAFYDGPYPFIQTGSISAAGKFITEYSQTLNELGLSVSKMFPSGTIVMTITGAKIAEVAVTTFDACFPDSIVGFMPDHLLDKDYLFYVLMAMKPALLGAMIVTTQPNINYVQIGGNYIPLPPLAEQEAIASHIESEMNRINAIRDSLEAQIATLTAYRKSLIHECVTGQRRITDADINRIQAHG